MRPSDDDVGGGVDRQGPNFVLALTHIPPAGLIKIYFNYNIAHLMKTVLGNVKWSVDYFLWAFYFHFLSLSIVVCHSPA